MFWVRKRIFGTVISIRVYIVNMARRTEKIKYNKCIKFFEKV